MVRDLRVLRIPPSVCWIREKEREGGRRVNATQPTYSIFAINTVVTHCSRIRQDLCFVTHISGEVNLINIPDRHPLLLSRTPIYHLLDIHNHGRPFIDAGASHEDRC